MPEEIKVIEGVSLIAIKKEGETAIDGKEDLDNVFLDNKVVIINTKDGKIINSNLDTSFKFPYPLKVYKVGVPADITSEIVKINYIQVNSDYPIIGIKMDYNKIPFLVLETSEGFRIISKSDMEDTKPVKETKAETKKSRSVKKKRAKKSSKRRKVKGKSSRKSRRV